MEYLCFHHSRQSHEAGSPLSSNNYLAGYAPFFVVIRAHGLPATFHDFVALLGRVDPQDAFSLDLVCSNSGKSTSHSVHFHYTSLVAIVILCDQ